MADSEKVFGDTERDLRSRLIMVRGGVVIEIGVGVGSSRKSSIICGRFE